MASSAALSVKRFFTILNRKRISPISSVSVSYCSSHRMNQSLSASSSSLSPPIPKKIPFNVSAHGKSWNDPYNWMSNTNDPDFINYLNQENSYADAFMHDTKSLQQQLFDEMISRLPPVISSPPERWGPWLYYQYIPEEKEYPVLCRKLASQKNGWAKRFLNYVSGGYVSEEVLLDWNELAEQYGKPRYVHVGTCRVSPDHNFLAYTLDITGNERFILQIKDLRTGCLLPKVRADGVISLAWAQDSCTLFYTVSDENHRPSRQDQSFFLLLVLCNKLGKDAAEDVMVFEEGDSTCCVDITSTKDGKFITINSNTRTTSEELICAISFGSVFILDAIKPQNGILRVRKRVPGVQYFVEHHSGFFYILTNAPLDEQKNLSTGEYYLVRCWEEDIQSADWQTVIMPNDEISLHDMDFFNDHLVLFLNKKGVPLLCSINMPINMDFKHQKELDNLDPWFFPLPSSSCRITPGSNHDYMNTVYRAVISSPVMPDVIVDYDMSRKTFSIVHQEEVRHVSSTTSSCLPMENIVSYKPSESQKDENRHVQLKTLQTWKDFANAYACERKEVISHDGIKIPLTILYSQEAWQKGHSPGLLQGYGAYGQAVDESWCPNRLSLLDRGWVVALADVRGGAGGDPSWHMSGKSSCKLNSIHDFVSCGQYLVKEGFVQKDRLAAMSISAGCLLVGAAINMNPYLFRAAILKVPFLDVCNTLLDCSLPLTVLDYEEFGNPHIKSQFEDIVSYSPYDNIIAGSCYPSMLVTASLHDSRVGVWEPAKWVAKVRDSTCSSCSHSVILKTKMTGGHFSEGGRFGQCKEAAFDYAFLLKSLGNFHSN
ncbi:Peptidase S9, prolyl oligopeptidase, catalytic domain [Dillenia turbinata]|uniref:Prolyl endopeptidase n=1 Tax=Dillenia turbinata TaxID=194707 RepID=A0AAN8ZDZ4_9MAGN